MSVVPAAPFLIDFGAREPAVEVAEEALRQAAGTAGDIDWAERIEEARAGGLEEGRKAAEAELEARLAEQRMELEQQHAEAREAWVADQGPRLAAQLAEGLRDLEDRIAASVERILRPFVAETVRGQAVTELRAIIADLVATNSAVTLEISGPDDLLEAVRSNLSASPVTASYAANDTCEVQVKVGGSIIETRIAAWLKASEGAA